MRIRSGALALALSGVIGLIGGAWAADTAKDIPAKHWARPFVEAVLSRGVMSAPGGKFDGNRRVTRTDLIRTMARFGQSLERQAWQPATGRRFKMPIPDSNPANAQGVTRYELAAVVARMGAYAAAGVPKPAEKRFGNSEALPKTVDVSYVKKTDPVYPSVQYLAKNRMLWPGSVLAKPGNEPVTGKDVAQAVAAVVTGVVDLRTDEPQNKPEIGPPPGESRGKPQRAGKAQ